MQPEHPLSEYLLDGRYQLLSPLNQSSTSTTVLGLDVFRKSKVVLRAIEKNTAKWLQQTCERYGQLRHPNLVQWLDVVQSEKDEQQYIVENYAPGKDFKSWAAEEKNTIRLCLGAAAILRGLQYLHAHGIVHGRLQPNTIRVEQERIGILPAVRLTNAYLTSDPTNQKFSNLKYCAPEMLANEAITPAIDLFCLGAVLFETLFGKAPGLHFLLSHDNNLIPEDQRNTLLGELIFYLLHPDPEQRPSLLSALESLSKIVEQPLQISLSELQSDYLSHPPILGRQETFRALDQVLNRVMHGEAIGLQLSGYGKSTIAKVCCLKGKLAGFKIFTIQDLVQSFLTINEKDIGPISFEQQVIKIVDNLTNLSASSPLLINLDSETAPTALCKSVAEQLFLILSQNNSLKLLVLWTHDLPRNHRGIGEHLSLPQLTPEESREMMQHLLYAVELPLCFSQIPELAGGDPRLIMELVRAQVEAGLPEKLIIPTNRIAIAAHRLTLLSPAERHLLAIIAHAFHPLSYQLLHVIAPDYTNYLPSLLNKGLVQDVNYALQPTNVMLKAAAQKNIVGDELKELHHRFCDILLAQEHPDLEALGHYQIRSGKIREGVRTLLQTVSPFTEDLEYALTQLAAPDDLRPLIISYLAKHYRSQGDIDRALSLAETLASEHSDGGNLLRAEILLDAGYAAPALESLKQVQASTMTRHLLVARAYFIQGEYDRVTQEAHLGRVAAGFQPNLLLQLDNLAGLSLIYTGKLEEGLDLLNHAGAEARKHNQLDTLARINNSIGIAWQRMGRLDEANRAYQEALKLSEELGDLRFAAGLILNLGTLAHRQLNLNEALNDFQRAAHLATRAHAGTTQAAALSSKANLLIQCGELEGAFAGLEQAEAIAKDAGAMTRLGHIYLYLAECWLLNQQRKKAEHCLKKAREYFGATEAFGRYAADLLEGELYCQAKEPKWVDSMVSNLTRHLSWDNPDRWRVHLLAGKAALIKHPSQPQQAIEQLELALSLARLAQGWDRTWEIHGLLAVAYAALGHQEGTTFHANGFQTAIGNLTLKIPLSYRLTFHQRPDVLALRQRVEEIKNVLVPSMLSLAEIQWILDINKEINHQLPLPQLMNHLLVNTLHLTGGERAFVLLRKAQGLVIEASYNVDKQAINRGLHAFSIHIAETAIAENRPVMTTDALDDERFKNNLCSNGLHLRAVLCVPLHVRNDIVGALYVDHSFKINAFQMKHIRLMEYFADQAGIALETARLMQEEQAKREELAKAKAQIESAHIEQKGQLIRQAEELDKVTLRLRSQEEELVRRYQQAKIIGTSKIMRELYLKLDRFAETDLPVLIYGESGTGKELIARAIHHTSLRREHPFIPINCAAIPPNLLESELFGHIQGSFTGAIRNRPGLFEAAGAGTLFLDEIGDMPLAMQAKLLRVLQEGTFRRIGDEVERKSECRVLSASNKKLEDLVNQGIFREDLFYRLNVLQVQLPSLRDRREDIPILAEHILSNANKSVKISSSAMAALLVYDWPGNIRQLENELLRAAVLCEGIIDLNCLSIATPPVEVESSTKPSHRKSVHQAAHDFERQVIEAALSEANNNVSLAAQRLGMHRVALHRRMRKLGITRKSDR